MPHIIAVDLELTQNEGSTQKIIEIGAIAFDHSSGKIKSVFSKTCDPGELPNDKITELTGITAEMIRDSAPLAEILQEFCKWVESMHAGRELITWGDGDVRALNEAARTLGLAWKPLYAFNIKPMFKPIRRLLGLSKTGGLGKTLNEVGLGFMGTAHRAAIDSINTARAYIYLQQIIEGGLIIRYGAMRVKGRGFVLEHLDEESVKILSRNADLRCHTLTQ